MKAKKKKKFFNKQKKILKKKKKKIGKLDGTLVWYSDNGVSIFSEQNYRNGKRNGVCKWFYNNGKLFKSITYCDGVIHGEALYYSMDGNLTSKQIYENGNLVAAVRI